jgi:predicted nucleic acid-binding protein
VFDFSDALLVATAQQTGITTIFSFETHFDGVSGITREEP